jgi:hypothetical protein
MYARVPQAPAPAPATDGLSGTLPAQNLGSEAIKFFWLAAATNSASLRLASERVSTGSMRSPNGTAASWCRLVCSGPLTLQRMVGGKPTIECRTHDFSIWIIEEIHIGNLNLSGQAGQVSEKLE